jgi:hypothetical protein
MLSYMSELKFHCKKLGLDNELESPVVKSVLKGASNTMLLEIHTPKQAPCCLDELKRLCHMATVVYSQYDSALIASMFSLAFFGFLRVSEYAATAANHAVKLRDCSLEGDNLVLVVCSSKNSLAPVSIKVKGIKGSSACPVCCFRRYRCIRPRDTVENRLFVDASGATVSSSAVNTYLKQLTKACGLRSMSSHTFRVGGASWAASVGWPDAVIRAHGHWSSSKFIGYIRSV